MAVAEFSITPLVETELKPFVDAAVEEVKRSGLKYEVDAMATTVEGDLDEILNVVKKAHAAVKAIGADRVVTDVKIDDRTTGVTINDEIESYRSSV